LITHIFQVHAFKLTC